MMTAIGYVAEKVRVRDGYNLYRVHSHEEAVEKIQQLRIEGVVPAKIGLKWGYWTGPKFGEDILEALPETAWGKDRHIMEEEIRRVVDLIYAK